MINVKQFGGKVNDEDITQYAQSPNWDGNKFINLEPTAMNISWQNLPKLLYKQICEKEGREPNVPIPVKPFDKSLFLQPSDEMKFIWYGHSVVLMRLSGLTMLIDPMLGLNASPIAPFATKRFSEGTLELIEDFPEIDLLLLSHDHYDHLDLDSMRRLKSKVKHYFTALGVGRHLKKWGIDTNTITEFDWWQSCTYKDINITFTPSRHFSGRGLTDRSKSLWGGWAFKTSNAAIWFSGDGGYGQHFVEVGQRLGPFDFGFLECGQYNENWHQIHMYPEESVLAAQEARVKQMMPVHWGAFSLAQHSWKEPIERFIAEVDKQKVSCIYPPLGALCSYSNYTSDKWWENIE